MANKNTVGESQDIEWKESWDDSYLKWVCGFANAKGGKILIGVNDKGAVVGIADHKKLLESIPNKIIQHLGIMPDINLLQKSKKFYIEISVEPQDVPISYHGAYYYRTGSTKQELKNAALHTFLLRKSGKTWDGIIEPKAELNDIDSDSIAAFKNLANKSNRIAIDIIDEDIADVLKHLNLTETTSLKKATILLFGKDVTKFCPQAYIKIGKFGTSDTDLLFQDIIKANCLKLADEVIDVLNKKYLQATISYKGLQRQEKVVYPPFALREALLNAIAHRDYSSGASIQISVYDDKIIIWNEGLLPEGLNPLALKKKHPSRPRNPLIADILFKAGYIESWGRGTLKIIEECKSAGLPEPIIEEVGGGVQITLTNDKYPVSLLELMGLNERQIKAVGFIKHNTSITNKQYQELTKCSRNTASNDLSDLIEKGILAQKGAGKGVGSGYGFKQ
jgi:ATP-dependent DNA helicase RecG